ncbi:uncharacterized protein [Venturia canescens]|uniref:uncharacterized protein n=1 Tax=Venturia canescens TaxID=32260 RepID=UPI001C9CB8E4|nr:uncharacterized protein LOC122408653 [Venturia canescens]
MEVELNDRKTFVITAGENGDEDEEIEMIRPNDLLEIVDLQKDDEKYKPLHSHVEHYNRRAAEAAKKYSSYISDLEINLKENHFIEEEKPFIAGFKHELDKVTYSCFDISINLTFKIRKKMFSHLKENFFNIHYHRFVPVLFYNSRKIKISCFIESEKDE